MRKITKSMLDAFLAKKNTELSNTAVYNGSIYLHGNEIVKTIDDKTIAISFRGWITPTTANRLNAIVSAVTDGDIGVGINRGLPELRYSNGDKQVIDSVDYTLISRTDVGGKL